MASVALPFSWSKRRGKIKTAAGGRRLWDACLPKKIVIDNRQNGKENFPDLPTSPKISDALEAIGVAEEREFIRRFGSANDGMNRERQIQHLIARSKFNHLGARLDSEKHAA
jgi:hypothetical protein